MALASNMMSFGDNSDGICPLAMIPLMTNNNNTMSPLHDGDKSSHSHHHLYNHLPLNIQEHQNFNIEIKGFYSMENNNYSSGGGSSSLKAKIMAHPHYNRLLATYVNCQKVGAPAEVMARLEEACAHAAGMNRAGDDRGCVGEDPNLDQFMEAYCEMLTNYEQELSKTFNEAMGFLQNMECQFKALIISDTAHGEAVDRPGSSEEANGNNSFIDPLVEDRELKGLLLRKYKGYIGSLKQEFRKKRKKGKLPKEARQQLLDWWSTHYKWPYPSESQKLALAQSTGLDQKQISNWFINQRKRHWKPTEDMKFVVMDAAHPHYYMEDIYGHPCML